MLKSNISIDKILHNNLPCYIKSGYGEKEIKTWPFYIFIKMYIEGKSELSRDLWVDWLIEEFVKNCREVKSMGGMFQGSVHRYALDFIEKKKDECWSNPNLLSRADIKKGATILVNKRFDMISSILNKGYQINLDDPIIAVKIKKKYVLKSGHHRASVMHILKYDMLPEVIVYPKLLWECRKWLVKIKKFIR
tara:strand:- start:557 stop:1132 length:576 start_codon:yes stop_codon:yes gene_type:complete